MPGKLWRQAMMMATPIWLILAVLLLPVVTKYKLRIESKSNFSTIYNPFYHISLDADSVTEYISYRNNRNGLASYSIYLINGQTVDQYNFNGNIISGAGLYFGDFDTNGMKEIYMTIERNDSIFLTAHQYKETTPFLPERFIARHLPVNNNVDIAVMVVGLADLDGDLFKEVIIQFTAGFSLQPRALFAYSIAKDSLWRTPLVGAALGRIRIADIDNDGINEIIAGTSAVANYDDLSYPFHDHSSWVMVFDNHLQFKFPPLEFAGAPTYTHAQPVRFREQNYILATYTWRGMANSDSALTLINPQGEIIKRARTLTDGQKYLILKDGLPYLFDINNNELFTLNEDLQMTRIFDFGDAQANLYTIDIENDGETEWVYNTVKDNTITIYRSNLSHPATFSYTSRLQFLPDAGIRVAPGFTGFEAKVVDRNLLIQYLENPYYIYKWPVALLVLAILIIIWYYILKYRELKVVARNKELLELQLSSFKSQFDAHFTFNALNAIGSIIYKGKKEEAYDYFTKFSSMVRTSLDNTREPIVKLADELQFVRHYFDLQKLRYKEKLKFNIHLDEQVNTDISIPKMLIQVHVENAIKHGTSPKKQGGRVTVALKREGPNLIISIEDDGIGRQAAKARNTDSPGKGLIMMREFYTLFEKLYKLKIAEEITDLVDDNNQPAGTKVTIKIPNIYV